MSGGRVPIPAAVTADAAGQIEFTHEVVLSGPEVVGNVSPIAAGLRGRCPRCGRGPLFKGFLDLDTGCRECGLDYAFADAGDGPAVFVIMIAGFLIVGAALLVEVNYAPPFWLHMVLWLPLATVTVLGLLRPLKGWFIAEQYRSKAREGRLDPR